VVAFYSEADNLVNGDDNDAGDVFLHDRSTKVTSRVSVSSRGVGGNRESTFPSLSGSGRYVVFTSTATNLVDGDTNNLPDVFVRDRETSTTSRVSIGSKGQQSDSVSYTYVPAISEDGSRVVFSSSATTLVPNDQNGTSDIFVHDRGTGITNLVSASSEGVQGNGPSLHAVISGNGRFVAFHSFANNLVPNDTNNASDVFVRDLDTGSTRRVSADPQRGQANGGADRAAISHDGSVIAYSSVATNLTAASTNGKENVFVLDVARGTTTQASVSDDDIKTAVCCILSTLCCVIDILDRKSVISPDGNIVAYRSDSGSLVKNDTNYYQDIFVFDRRTQTTSRVSVDSRGVEGNRPSVHHGVSFDGRYVAFSSEATNLVPGDTNRVSDVFVHDRQTGTTERVSIGSAQQTEGTKITVLVSLAVVTVVVLLAVTMRRRRRSSSAA
jgi:Tol biopolymer transport system component